MSLTKSLLLLLLVGFLFNVCKKDDPSPTQLLANPDLEQTPSNQDWTFGYYYNLMANPNKYKSTYTTEAAASGSHSLKIQCDTVRNDTTFCFYTQKITMPTIPTGAKLTLKAKIKTANLQSLVVILL
jgi:hypothetical protein